MKLLIEDADIERLGRCIECFPIDGVSVASKLDITQLNRIRALIGEDCELHVPISSLRAEEIVEEAQQLADDLGSNTYIRIPIGTEGFKAMKLLDSSRVSFDAVAVRTPMQALIAGNCGASYVVTFVNRLDSRNAVETVKNIFDALKHNELETQVIASRFKNSRQVGELCEYGLSAVTVSTDMLSSLIADEYHINKVDDCRQ